MVGHKHQCFLKFPSNPRRQLSTLYTVIKHSELNYPNSGMRAVEGKESTSVVRASVAVTLAERIASFSLLAVTDVCVSARCSCSSTLLVSDCGSCAVGPVRPAAGFLGSSEELFDRGDKEDTWALLCVVVQLIHIGLRGWLEL